MHNGLTRGSAIEAGEALRLKLGQVQIPSGPHTVLRTTYAFESPRAEGLLKILLKIAWTRDRFATPGGVEIKAPCGR